MVKSAEEVAQKVDTKKKSMTLDITKNVQAIKAGAVEDKNGTRYQMLVGGQQDGRNTFTR